MTSISSRLDSLGPMVWLSWISWCEFAIVFPSFTLVAPLCYEWGVGRVLELCLRDHLVQRTPMPWWRSSHLVFFAEGFVHNIKRHVKYNSCFLWVTKSGSRPIKDHPLGDPRWWRRFASPSELHSDYIGISDCQQNQFMGQQNSLILFWCWPWAGPHTSNVGHVDLLEFFGVSNRYFLRQRSLGQGFCTPFHGKIWYHLWPLQSCTGFAQGRWEVSSKSLSHQPYLSFATCLHGVPCIFIPRAFVVYIAWPTGRTSQHVARWTIIYRRCLWHSNVGEFARLEHRDFGTWLVTHLRPDVNPWSCSVMSTGVGRRERVWQWWHNGRETTTCTCYVYEIMPRTSYSYFDWIFWCMWVSACLLLYLVGW